ncbi:phage tail tape measure protein [Streptomyces avermitilis]|uniref:phage tail tape measure protein n=1 Tax=Streptomyces avermitilis TaxID=33903 RepID=UPI0037FA70B3
MPAPEIAVAYVSIVPSLQGFAGDLKRQMVGPSENAGQQSGDGFASNFKAKALGGAVAIGAAFAKLMGDAIEQSNVTSKLQAQLGASGKDASRYGKVAGQLYSKGVTDTFEGAAESIKAVAQSGLLPPGATNKQLASIATKASDVATVFDQDLGGVTNAVAQMVKTGLAKNSTEAFDIITKGFQGGADKAGDLLDTFNEYGTQFRKLGVGGPQALGLIQQGLKGGARDADLAADALKEFSIRAIDGSDSTKQGFKDIGLSAETMSKRIGKGGKSANEALDLTLDRLRNIKDPVKQSQTAVALFGTQAEDLGKALFAMDPSKATDAIGKVGGSAGKLGKTIRSGPQYQFQTFMRTMQQGLVQALVDHAIPALMDVVDAVKAVAKWAPGAWAWVKDAAPYLAPLAVVVGGLTLALSANAIATGAVTLIMSAYRTAMLIGAAVTNGFAVAQGLLNAVMALNPFVLVAIAIIALGVALVVAYKKSETFRNIVQGAFKAIGAAATWMWENAIKPVVDFIVGAFKLWWTAVKIYITFVVVLFALLGKAFMYLYEKAIAPVVDWIVAAFLMWWSGVKLYFSYIRKGFAVIGEAAKWLYNKAIKPVVDWIVAAFKVWWSGVKVIFGYFKRGLSVLGDAAKWLYHKAIKPALDWIAAKAQWLWAKGVKPAFDMLKRGVHAISDAFTSAKDTIGRQWSKLSAIAKKPIAFIVNTVYSDGIVPVWNKVASAFGAPKLKKLKFASGGVMPGYTPGRDPHKFYSPTGGGLELSGGESIMRPEFTRAVGAGFVHKMNGIAKRGGISGVRNALGGDVTQRFADGGIFGWIKSAASAAKGVGSDAWNGIKKGASWLGDTLESSARAGIKAVVNPLLSKIPGADSPFGKMAKGIPSKIVDSIFGYSKDADKKMDSAGIGGKGTQAALRWARTQNGKPYQWGGNGNPSWDCSGFMSAIESVIRGQKPHRRWATGSFSGATAPAGWVRGMKAPFMIGVTNAGVGHTAGTLNGVNVESRGGGGGVIVGPRARGYKSSLFRDWYGFAPSRKYDSGGWLQPGATMSVNQTGKPEAILTAGQWNSVANLANSGGGGLQPGDTLMLTPDGRTKFEAYIDRRADERISKGLVGPTALGRDF